MIAHTAPETGPLETLIETLKLAWRTGAPPDSAGVLREHPELLRHRSLALDLAYEEYCVREVVGHPPDLPSFCRQFPAFQPQLR